MKPILHASPPPEHASHWKARPATDTFGRPIITVLHCSALNSDISSRPQLLLAVTWLSRAAESACSAGAWREAPLEAPAWLPCSSSSLCPSCRC